MVHALRRVHGLLAPDGCLVDIRPVDERAEIVVRAAGAEEQHAGWLAETDEGIEYRQAENAMSSVVRDGWFTVETARIFTFSHHAGSLSALTAHLATTWSDAVILPEVAARLDVLTANASSAEVILRETAWMRVLRPAALRSGQG